MMNVILILVYGNYRYEDFLNQLNSKGIKKERFLFMAYNILW